MAIAGLAMGSHGAIGSTYNIQPKLNVAMHRAYREGKVAEAMKLQEQLNVVIAGFVDRCNCRARGLNIIGGIKAVLRLKYGIDVGPCRPAASPDLSEEAAKELVAWLDSLSWTVE